MMLGVPHTRDDAADRLAGPVEVDATCIGGNERNKHEWKKQNAGRITVGKTAVVGMRDRDANQVDASVVETTDAPTLRRGRTRGYATTTEEEMAIFEGSQSSN